MKIQNSTPTSSASRSCVELSEKSMEKSLRWQPRIPAGTTYSTLRSFRNQEIPVCRLPIAGTTPGLFEVACENACSLECMLGNILRAPTSFTVFSTPLAALAPLFEPSLSRPLWPTSMPATAGPDDKRTWSQAAIPLLPARPLPAGTFDDPCQAQWLHRRFFPPTHAPTELTATSPHAKPSAKSPRPPSGKPRDAQPRQRPVTASPRTAAAPASPSVTSTPGPALTPQPSHSAAAAEAAAAAKATVLFAVGEREAAVGALRALLPAPPGLVERRRATVHLLLDPLALSSLRTDCAILLQAVRRATLATLQAVHAWKGCLRTHYSYFASLDSDDLHFYVGGVDMLQKMCSMPQLIWPLMASDHLPAGL